MWTKVKTVAGVFVTLAIIILVTLLGVAAFAVAAFFFWGLIGIGVIVFIVFLIHAAITDP